MRLPYLLAATAALIVPSACTLATGSTSSLEEALRALDQAVLADSELHRDVLSARAGILRNYDPLVREERNLRAALELLSAQSADAEITTAVDRLAELVAREEGWMEQFKSDNALLHNSLAYFELFSTTLTQRDDALIPKVSALNSAMLHLTLDTSPAAIADVETRLAGISSEGLPTTDADLTRGLVTHGRMLLHLLPETDKALKSLFALPGGTQEQIIREMILERQHTAELRAGHARYALLGIALILVLLLLYVGARLRSRARALRQRAALEHMIAGISTRFVSARPHEIAGVAEHALEELAGYVRADRAYFHGNPQTPGRLPFALCWCRQGVESPPQWPEQAMALVQHFEATESGTISIRSIDQLPPGANKNVLAAAGVRAWLCIPASGAPGTGILGFDTVRSQPMVRGHELGLLRMVADAFISAAHGKYLELERARLESKLQSARRMEVVGALTSGIAHNFNNIIGAILGYTETAQAQLRSPTPLADHLDEIRRAGERARDLVQHILTFGRRRAMRRARISVRALIDEARSMLDATLPAHVRLVVQETSPELFISGEASQLQQVVVNLCNNAGQAMDEPGNVAIEVSVREIPPAALIEPRNLPSGSYVVISVTDPGRGMDEATLERIFEPFFTTRLEGNGLGLATVREIVLEHAGSVNVQSIPEAGTRFEVWLPNRSAAPNAQRGDDSHDAGRGNGETILVLESDRSRLLRHEEILAALGYEPAGFTEPAAAWAACLSDTMHFDAALLCAHLNGMAAALEQAAMLQTRNPGLPIILATASTREWNAPALAEAGIAEIIQQPLSSVELATALARCMAAIDTKPRARTDAA